MTAPLLRSLRLAGPADVADSRHREGEAPDAIVLDAGGQGPVETTGMHLTGLVRWARDHAVRRWVIVRLGALADGTVDAALDALLPDWPDAVLLPACRDGRDIQHCGVKLGVREARIGLPAGRTAILAAPGPAGFLAPGGFAGASARLHGLVWDRAGLETALGAIPATFDAGGDMAATAVLRTLLLLGARAAGVAAYDAASETAGPAFAADCRRAAALGFDGRLCRDPLQIATINGVFLATRPWHA